MCETHYLHPPTVFTFVPNDQTSGKTTITFIPPEVAGNVLSVHINKDNPAFVSDATCVKNTARLLAFPGPHWFPLVPTGKWTSGN